MDPILTIIFSAILSGVVAQLIAEKRIRDEPELHKNKILLEMKVDLIKSLHNLIDDMSFTDRHSPEFHSWFRRIITLNLRIAELTDDDSSVFTDNAIKYVFEFKDNKINMGDFSEEVSKALARASA